jgi:hypothetical protein
MASTLQSDNLDRSTYCSRSVSLHLLRGLGTVVLIVLTVTYGGAHAWAPAATVDRRRYPDARLPDVLLDGLGGRCKSKARTSALGGSPLNLFSEVVATLIKVRFYGMSALHPKNGHRQLDRPCPKSADFVAKVENRTTPEISRKLLFGLLYRYLALQRDYGGP